MQPCPCFTEENYHDEFIWKQSKIVDKDMIDTFALKLMALCEEYVLYIKVE